MPPARPPHRPLSLPACSVDPFAKKDWYDIKAPSAFTTRNVGKTLVTRTAGTKIASDGLKGRVLTVSLADLQNVSGMGVTARRSCCVPGPRLMLCAGARELLLRSPARAPPR